MLIESKNSSFAKLLRIKGAVLHAVRSWFWNQGYTEVQTPLLVPSPAMEENLEAISVGSLFLHTSPEFAMKRILAHGLCRIYQIVPCFREEETGPHHCREFSMLEWYCVGIGTSQLMKDTLSLISAAARSINVSLPSFEYISTSELLDPTLSPEEWLFRWVDKIEPSLPSAAVVYDYPAWGAALARVRGAYADRFEIYLHGLELANAFHEELNANELRLRWQEGNTRRQKSQRPPHPIDEQFLSAVNHMPRCSGIALGVDRLVMALTQTPHINDTQLQL